MCPGLGAAIAPRASPCSSGFPASVVRGNGDFGAIKLGDKLRCWQCSVLLSLSTRGWWGEREKGKRENATVPESSFSAPCYPGGFR